LTCDRIAKEVLDIRIAVWCFNKRIPGYEGHFEGLTKAMSRQYIQWFPAIIEVAGH
jgi:hypothetical protein